jgi:ornithine cyclodeaminase/alanine dehydrogenase-like protein (mu-crystallin family)
MEAQTSGSISSFKVNFNGIWSKFMVNLKILTATDIRELVQMSVAIDAVQHAYASIAHGTTSVPLRIDVDQTAHQSHTFFMPALVDGASLGMKIVSVFPHNRERHQLPTIHAIVMLIEAHTGRPLAMMDGTFLTVLRTGASAGVATRLLARPDSRHLVLIGAGAQAWAQVAAVCAVRPISHITIVNRTRARAEHPTCTISVAESRATALAQADVVCLATSASTPVFADSEIRPGTHINGIGSFTHTMIEADPRTVGRSYVAVDQFAAAWSEAGELIAARDQGLLDPARVVQLGDIANGTAPARSDHSQITFFKSVGNAAQDVAVAQIAYTAAMQQQRGHDVTL